MKYFRPWKYAFTLVIKLLFHYLNHYLLRRNDEIGKCLRKILFLKRNKLLVRIGCWLIEKTQKIALYWRLKRKPKNFPETTKNMRPHFPISFLTIRFKIPLCYETDNRSTYYFSIYGKKSHIQMLRISSDRNYNNETKHYCSLIYKCNSFSFSSL